MRNYDWFVKALRTVISDCELRAEVQSYSGRFMYGKNCLGLSVNQQTSEMEIFGNLLREIAGGNPEEIPEQLENLADIMGDTRSDSLGLGSILYFPRITWDAKWDNEDSDLDSEDEESEDDSENG